MPAFVDDFLLVAAARRDFWAVGVVTMGLSAAALLLHVRGA